MLAVTIAGVIGVVAPAGAADKEGRVTAFSATPEIVSRITAGPDGNLWFTNREEGWIGRITPKGKVTKFTAGITGVLGEMTAGPDGNVWFTEDIRQGGEVQLENLIGRITPKGTVTTFSVDTIDASMGGIITGPDGNVWFTEEGSGASDGRVGRITPAGVITMYPAGVSFPARIAAGSDGNLWYTDISGDAFNEGGDVKFGRITPEGVVTLFASGVPAEASIGGIAAGPDGNLWYNWSFVGDEIGRMTPAGVVTVFPLPGPGSAPGGITAGCDGNVWFVEPLTSEGAAQIGRITPEGEVTEFSPGPGKRTPHYIAAGPDGNLWFSEINRIGRIGPGPLPKPRGLDLPAACPGKGRRN